jgi:Flp pilus assembly protein TadD
MLPGLSNQRQIDKSQAAFRAGDNAAALAAASKAVNAESWSATAYGQKALALENAGDLEGASTAISRARALEPTNWRWPLIAVSIDTARGDGAAAVRDLRQARALRRYSKFFGQASPVIR